MWPRKDRGSSLTGTSARQTRNRRINLEQPWQLRVDDRRPAARRLQAAPVRRRDPPVHDPAPARLHPGTHPRRGPRARREVRAAARWTSRSNARPGWAFYNTTRFDFARLLEDPEGLRANLIDYITGFSANIDVFERFKFENEIATLDEKNRLYLVTSKFAEVDLHPDTVPNAEMGDLFEYLIHKFAEASNETAGEHYTPRDAIRLMVDLLFAEDNKALLEPGTVRTIYDPTAGTGGHALGGRGAAAGTQPRGPAAAVRAGDQRPVVCDLQVRHDRQGPGRRQHPPRRHPGRRPVLGPHLRLLHVQPALWRRLESLRRRPSRRKRSRPGTRFVHGLPSIGDGQMLFLCHLAHKMRPAHEGGGRAGIVLNGSPLFNGAAESGPSRIRQWLLEYGSGRGDRRAADQHVLQHRHRDLHLDPRQHQTPRAAGQGPVDRRDLVLDEDAQEPRREEPRGRRRGRETASSRSTTPSTTPTPTTRRSSPPTTSATGPSPSNGRCSTRAAKPVTDRRATRSRTQRSGDTENVPFTYGGNIDGRRGPRRDDQGLLRRRGPAPRPRRLGRHVRRPRSATRSRSPATSTSTSRPGRSPRSTPTWRSRSPRSWICCGRWSSEHRDCKIGRDG